MKDLYYNLSEEEFSKGRKNLLWIFSALFFIAGIWVILQNLVFGHKQTIPLILASAPFSISLVVGFIAILSSVKRKDQYFAINSEKLEFRYGILSAKKYSFNWSEIIELVMPHKQKKALLQFRDGSSYTIDLTWLQKKKSSLIRKHLYQAAWEKKLKISKVMYLKKQQLS
jgi:hypothetical protein